MDTLRESAYLFTVGIGHSAGYRKAEPIQMLLLRAQLTSFAVTRCFSRSYRCKCEQRDSTVLSQGGESLSLLK